MNWDNESLKRRGLITTGFHLPYNPDLVGLARLMRKDLTPAEKKLCITTAPNRQFHC
jgi:hypothetical protein